MGPAASGIVRANSYPDRAIVLMSVALKWQSARTFSQEKDQSKEGRRDACTLGRDAGR